MSGSAISMRLGARRQQRGVVLLFALISVLIVMIAAVPPAEIMGS